MKIENRSLYNIPGKNPAFASIYRSVYFIKCQDGQYRQVTNSDTIRKLQRGLISWLNKSFNDGRRAQKSSNVLRNNVRPASENFLMNRFVNFILNSDRDYLKRKVAKSIYLDSNRNIRSYIVTGETAELCSDAKDIGKIHSQIKEARNEMLNYGFSKQQAELYISSADSRRLRQAKYDYHRNNEECVRSLMKDDNVDKSVLNLYFEPNLEKTKKGKLDFKLVNALIQKYMFNK